MERVTDEPHGEREFYLPHKPVVREAAENTKMQIVFDASAKAEQTSPLLNDWVSAPKLTLECAGLKSLQTGCSLQRSQASILTGANSGSRP